MILRRLGNKSSIASEIQKYFPAHKTYIEPFFGAGGMFFNKPKAKYNFLNDIDNDVYNCFDVLIRQRKELTDYLTAIPYHQAFWEECKKGEPANKIEKAVYFLVLSNFGYMGKPDTLKFDDSNSKKILLQNINKTYDFLSDVDNKFTNCDFRDMLKKIAFKNIDDVFIYNDPPYLNTGDNYIDSFKEQDSINLFDMLQNTGCKWAMSEFDNPFIIKQAKERNLNVHIIGERQSMKNRNTEILVTNYQNHPSLFD